MRVIVNGEGADVRSTNVAALLSEMDFPFTHVAIAVNQRVVPRGRWADTALASCDRIEIITPRQGG